MERLKIELPRPSFKNGKLVDVISEPARIGAGENKTASRPGLSQWVGMMLLEAEEVELLDVAGQKVK